MIYKTFKDLKLSQLGFGCMRFTTDPATGEIDQEKVNEMFDLAIRGGVNYFDTAYPYLGGKSEIAMAEALSRYPRDSYFIADKFPGHSLTAPIDNIALFHVSLRKCKADYFDFYLLHNITEWSEKFYESEEYHIIPDMLQMKKEGKIRYLGFSFHGGPELLEAFLTRHEGEFDFVQIQLNYLDWTLQDAKKKYEIIVRHGLGVWVMEPCRGGKLAALPEAESARLRALHEKNDSTEPVPGDASYAFRFLQGLPGVTVVLSGMSALAQMQDNISYMSEFDTLTTDQMETVSRARAELAKIPLIPCTTCNYCAKVCPMEIGISGTFTAKNIYTLYGDLNAAKHQEGWLVGGHGRKQAINCVKCGACEEACPQHIQIRDELEKAAELFGQ